MRNSLLFILLFFSVSCFSTEFKFIENVGQWDSAIRFNAEIPGGNILIKQNSIQYFFYDTKALKEIHGTDSKNNEIPFRIVELNFLNSNPLPKLVSKNSYPEKYNFFLGNDSSKWKNNVKAFSEILMEDIYPNIDFRIYQINGVLKFEYIVHQGGNPAEIQLNYSGNKGIQLVNNEILIETELNLFKEINPYSYQKINNKEQIISTHFVLKNKVISFELSSYDKKETLVIDPELVFSSYSGSASDNWSHTATYDSKGNLYAGGSVFGPSYLITENSFQTSIGGASSSSNLPLITDIVINKYDTKTGILLYATFLGGASSEIPHSLIVNSKDELIIFGTTSSPNFPISQSAFDKTFNGGSPIGRDIVTSNISFQNGSDIFVSVLSENGEKLVGSTFLGGSKNDGINNSTSLEIRNYGDEYRGEVVVDNKDNIYVASTSLSSDFPITDGTTISSSLNDAVILRLAKDCSALQWSTFCGGSNYDAAFGIRVNDKNEVFVTGVTQSSGLNLNSTKTLSGLTDGFIIKYKNDKPQIFTYLGTDKSDIGILIDLDKQNNVYVLGLTSGVYPVSSGVYRNENSGQFIHSFTSDLKSTNFSTVFGSGRGIGFIDIVPTAFLVNECGNIYVAGWGGKVNVNTRLNLNSTTVGLPITRDAFKRTTTGSNYYFMILENDARSLLFGSFFGSEAPPNADSERGDHLDGGTCRFDKKGVIYHSACVCKAENFVGFPLKNAVSSTHNSTNCNMAAFKFDIGALQADFNLTDGKKINGDEFCSPAKINLNNNSKNALTYEWFINDELISRVENLNYNFTKGGEYTIKLKAYNTTKCIQADSIVRKINIKQFETSVSKDTVVCSNIPVQLNATGGKTYKWTPVNGLSAYANANTVAKVDKTTIFKVEISDGICSVNKEVKIEINNTKLDFKATESKEICEGDSLQLSVSGNFQKYYWEYENKIDSSNAAFWIKPLKSTDYSIKAYYNDGCISQKNIQISIDKSFQPSFSYELEYNCNEPAKISFTNNTNGNPEITWKLGNGKTFLGASPQIQESFNEIFIEAKNNIGCKLTSLLKIENSNWTGKLPNIITPNGDGLNDYFDTGIDNTSIQIMNRWGKEIFNDANYLNNWGKNISNGTYFYSLQLPNKKQCKGYIDVIN